VRLALAILASVLLVVGLVAPHHHDGRLGEHSCAACLAGAASVARDETPSVDRAEFPGELLQLAPGMQPVGGVPLGAVPGQSPPHA